MLAVTERTKTGKGYNRKLKAKGLIPAVVYGVGVENPISIELNPSEFVKTINTPKRYNSVIELEINYLNGKKEVKKAILKGYQKHPFRSEYEHLDFYVYNPEDKHVFRVPFKTTGKSEGVVAGGKLRIAMKKVKVESYPELVPVELSHDITKLQRGEVVRVGDIEYPKGVKPLYNDRQALVSVTALKLGPGGQEESEEDELLFDE